MKHTATDPIGVFDSGVGGLTVLRELRRLLPGERIVYFGDSANCPFGNRTEAELTALTGKIFSFFRDRNAKLAVAACNTTSALIDRRMPDYGYPILGVIGPIAKKIASEMISEVGLIATEFTVRSGCYERLIRRENESIRVYGQENHNLAGLIDQGDFDSGAIPADVERSLRELFQKRRVKHVILGCTHYPIVRDVFERAAPGVVFHDPAEEQALSAREILIGQGLLNPAPVGETEIHTSGDPALFEAMLHRLDIPGCTGVGFMKL